MSEQEFQPELDDELLSAYLDDELTAEERAAVEARLANDPEAQHLLHQLRSVSQSVQMLPLEGVGRDLSGEISRRIETKNFGDGSPRNSGSSAVGEITPRLPIFGSRRSWIWASLAVAAGLMIMVLEHGEEKENKLPALARNDGANVTSSARDRDEPVKRQKEVPAVNGGKDESRTVSLGAPRSPIAASAPSPPADSSPTDKDDLAVRKLAVPAPSSGGAPAETAGRSDEIAASTPAPERHDASRARGGAMSPRSGYSISASGDTKAAMGKLGESGAAPRPETAAGEGVAETAKPEVFDTPGGGQAEREDTNALVVVHVSAKPTAIRGGEFEKLLTRNGVEFDEQDQAEGAAATSEKGKKSVARPTQSRDANRDTDARKNPVDIVVVDAPRDVVAACMADLQQDASNFASVEVEVEQPAESKEAAPAAPDVAKQLGSELRQYNRGIVSEKRPADNQFSASDSANKDRGQLKQESKQPANTRDGQSSQNNQPSQNQRASQANRGRAMRMQATENETQTLSDSQLGRRAAGFGGGGEAEVLRRRVVQQQKPQTEDSDDVRVLFMLSPEAASPAPSKKVSD
jgi:hypothetical protein